ncbi:hypothetical protein GCM10022416_10150 [Actinomadura keratinilytica]|uniref:Uncharacterized protein n=1 Tax=Actinomadura keratinilytica TaxID=547461 RepID=A0ABP7Y692_9ACTN
MVGRLRVSVTPLLESDFHSPERDSILRRSDPGGRGAPWKGAVWGDTAIGADRRKRAAAQQWHLATGRPRMETAAFRGAGGPAMWERRVSTAQEHVDLRV